MGLRAFFENMLFTSKEHFLIGTPFFCLNFVAQKAKTGITTIMDTQYFPNVILKDNMFIDSTVFKNLKGNKNVIYMVAPQTHFLYRTKMEAKARGRGINGLVSVIKERFNVDITQNKVAVLDAETGIEVTQTTKILPENLCFVGAQKKELNLLQNELIRHKFFPKKLYFLSLFFTQALSNYLKFVKADKPVIVFDFSIRQSSIYVVHAGQIMAAYPPSHGLKNIITLGRRECSLPDDVSVYKYLTGGIKADEEQKGKLIQRIISDLKSYMDFFEVQSGMAIGNLFVSNLPEEMAWIETTLSKSLDLPVLPIDYKLWLKDCKIEGVNTEKVPPKALFGMISALLH